MVIVTASLLVDAWVRQRYVIGEDVVVQGSKGDSYENGMGFGASSPRPEGDSELS